MKKLNPLVSVIMPVYNSEKYIECAVNSIINQTYDNWELILVIDCPTDGTVEIIKSLNLDSRIKVFYNDENKGIAYSRNRAIKEACGKYVALLDDDDIATPWRLEEQVNYLEANIQIDAVGGDYFYIDEKGEIIDILKEKVVQEPKKVRVSLLFHNVLINGTMMIKKSVLTDNKIEYHNGMLGMEDFDFWIRLSKVAKIANLDKVFLQYRMHSENESTIVLSHKAHEKKDLYAKLQKMSLELEGYVFTQDSFYILKNQFCDMQPDEIVLEQYLSVCIFLNDILQWSLQKESVFYRELKEIVKEIAKFKCRQMVDERMELKNLQNNYYHLNRTDELKSLFHKNLEEYNCFCDELLEKYNVRDIKEHFNLEYYITDVKSDNQVLEAAVFIHLYYNNLLSECYRYIKYAANVCDVYITSSNEEIIETLLGNLSKDQKDNVYVKLIPNRGHDIGALLLYHSVNMVKYKYCCFLHDKKSQHLEIIDQGYEWNQMIWDSMLHSTEYIVNVINTFEQEPRLGLLTAPEPFWGVFAYDVGESWGDVYNEVVALTAELGLKCNVSYDKPPLTLGTAFWTRTEALFPLLNYEFEQEMFPEEGVGKFSYAIERIFSYVAQSQHYYTGVIMDNDTARKRSNMLSKSNTLAFEWLKTHYGAFNLEQLKEENKKAQPIVNLLNQYAHVHVYGAGAFAKKFCEEFPPLFNRVEYIVVSDGHKKENYFNGHKIIEIKDLEEVEDSVAFILAISSKYINEAVQAISQKGAANYIVYVP